MRYRLEHATLRGAQGLAGSVSQATRDRIGSALGAVAGDVVRIRRDLVEANLRQAFPELDDERRRAIARESYRHLGREALAMLALGARTPEEIRERTPVRGWDELKAALEHGRGIVMATAHFGNWELGGASLAVRGLAVDAVVQRQSNPLVDRDLAEVRGRLGFNLIDRREAPRKVLRALQQNHVIGFVSDQDARRAGVFVPFFGRPASTHRGAALFAIRSGAPLFVGLAVRMPDGTYDCRTSEVTTDRSGPLDEAVERLTAAYTRRIEDEIRTAPEQYFWLHRRWKTKPRTGSETA